MPYNVRTPATILAHPSGEKCNLSYVFESKFIWTLSTTLLKISPKTENLPFKLACLVTLDNFLDLLLVPPLQANFFVSEMGKLWEIQQGQSCACVEELMFRLCKRDWSRGEQTLRGIKSVLRGGAFLEVFFRAEPKCFLRREGPGSCAS
ncbi:Trafficking Kinesin-Binding Protein 2 [Manis pentadactyla]|nr:Trafficking Kinesin-Binding Protein 2 [Manis pentadactyla]